MHIYSFARAAIVACVLAVPGATVAPAFAKPIEAQLRVEANGNDLDHGYSYLTDTRTFHTSTSAPCGGTGNGVTAEGPTPLGLLLDANDYTGRLTPVQVSDRFEGLGPFVCGLASYTSSDSAFWLYKVNHKPAEVGAADYRLQPQDTVLWYFSNTAENTNTGQELAMTVVSRTVQVGQPVQLKVFQYDDAGSPTPAAGVRIVGGGDVLTDANGNAEVVYTAPGRPVVRGARGPDIPTQGMRLCIWETLATECHDLTYSRLVGTRVADVIPGGPFPEFITGRAGNDRIDSRRGGADSVRCGVGRDTARADPVDRVHRSCEKVIRS